MTGQAVKPAPLICALGSQDGSLRSPRLRSVSSPAAGRSSQQCHLVYPRLAFHPMHESRYPGSVWNAFGMDAATLIIALAGLLTTALAPVLQGAVTARNQNRAWQRDARAALYIDALTNAQVSQQLADAVVYEFFDLSRPPEVKHADLITARMRLLAPEHVYEAWNEFVLSDEAFRFDLSENYPGLGHAGSGAVVPEGDPGRERLLRAISQLTGAIQASFGGVRKRLTSAWG